MSNHTICGQLENCYEVQKRQKWSCLLAKVCVSFVTYYFLNYFLHRIKKLYQIS